MSHVADDVDPFVPARLAGALVMAAAGIHVAVVPEHLDEWPLAGAFFVVLAVVEAGLGCLLCVRPGMLAALAGVAVNAGTVALWIVSRSSGLPIGPEPGMPEPIGLPDSVSSLVEAVAVVLLAEWLWQRRAVRRRAPDPVSRLSPRRSREESRRPRRRLPGAVISD